MTKTTDTDKTVIPDCTGCMGKLGDACIFDPECYDCDVKISVVLNTGTQYDDLRMSTCDRRRSETQACRENTKVTFAQCHDDRTFHMLMIPVQNIVMVIAGPIDCCVKAPCQCDDNGLASGREVA